VAFNIIGGGNDGNKQHVKTKEEADHSLPYMIAVALLDGAVTPAQYDAKRILKQDVQELMQKVKVVSDKGMSERFPAEMPCRLDVELNNGKKLSIEKHDYEGFYTRRMSWETVVAKFNSIASPYASELQCAAIVDAVGKLELNGITHLAEVLNESFVGNVVHV